MTPEYWDTANRQLAKRDPVMRRLVKQYRGLSIVSRGDPFKTLARSIVGQQISVKAADSVWKRVIVEVPRMTPKMVLASTPAALSACGLSGRKVDYIQGLAEHFISGKIKPARWKIMDDEAVIEELIDVRGIGRWTAEMFLMFNLLRPNILPLDDIGLQKGVAVNYFDGERASRQRIIELAELWQPWCSVATWYLWRSLDPVAVEY